MQLPRKIFRQRHIRFLSLFFILSKNKIFSHFIKKYSLFLQLANVPEKHSKETLARGTVTGRPIALIVRMYHIIQ